MLFSKGLLQLCTDSAPRLSTEKLLLLLHSRYHPVHTSFAVLQTLTARACDVIRPHQVLVPLSFCLFCLPACLPVCLVSRSKGLINYPTPLSWTVVHTVVCAQSLNAVEDKSLAAAIRKKTIAPSSSAPVATTSTQAVNPEVNLIQSCSCPASNAIIARRVGQSDI